jgi:hypothetical protein
MQTNDGTSQCRICFLSHEPLISPCLCRGSMLYAHNHCLVKWFCSKHDIITIATKQQKCFLTCEVCKYDMEARIERKQGFSHLFITVSLTVMLFTLLILFCGIIGMYIGYQVSEETYTTMKFVTPIVDMISHHVEQQYGLMLDDLLSEELCFIIRTQWTAEPYNSSYMLFKNTPKECLQHEPVFCDDPLSYSCSKQVSQEILEKTKIDHHVRLKEFWEKRLFIRWNDMYVLLDVVIAGMVLSCCLTSFIQYLQEYDFYIPQLLACATLVLFLKDFTVVPAVPLDEIPPHFCITLIWSYLLKMGPCSWLQYFYIAFTAIIASTSTSILMTHAIVFYRRLFFALAQTNIRDMWSRLVHDSTLKERERDLSSFVTLQFQQYSCEQILF